METKDYLFIAVIVLFVIWVIVLKFSVHSNMRYATIVWRERKYSPGDGVTYYFHITLGDNKEDTTYRVKVPMGVYYDHKPGNKVLFPDTSADYWYTSVESEQEFLKSSPKLD